MVRPDCTPGLAEGRRWAFVVAPIVLGSKPSQMGEAAAGRDFRDACSFATAEQVAPRALKAQLSQERKRGTPEKALEMLLQGAWGDPANLCQVRQTPCALRLGLEPLDRLLQGPRQRLTNHCTDHP